MPASIRNHTITAPSAGIILIFGIPFFLWIPGPASPVFGGPDATRWVAPLGIWMSITAALFTVTIPFWRKRLDSSGALAAIGICHLFAGLMIFVAVQRLTSGLRVLESYNQVMILRVASGQSLYPDPETMPIGPIYAPLYFLISGFLHRIFPAGFAWGRIVSLCAALSTAGLTYLLSRNLGAARNRAIWAPPLFLATYPILYMFHDNVSVDPLLTLLVTATALALVRNTPRSDGIALFIAGLACFTKQTAALPAAVVFGTVLLSRRTVAVFWSLPLFLLSGAVLLVATDGHAWTHLVAIPSRHGWHGIPFPGEMGRQLLLHSPMIVFAVAAARREPRMRFLVFSTAVLLSCLSGLMHTGGWVNSLMPLEGLLVSQAACLLPARKAFLGLQLCAGLYNPFAPLYPWATIRNPDRTAVRLARETAGPVWFPVDSDLAYRAGKREWDNAIAVSCLTWTGALPPQRLIRAVAEKEFDLIIVRNLSRDEFERLQAGIPDLVRAGYREEGSGQVTVFRRHEE